MKRLWTKDFVFITLSTFFVFFNLQMITPTLSPYINAGIGGNSLIGVSNAAWAAAAIVTRTILGKVLATTDKRRLLFIAFAVYVLATAMYLLASSVPVLILVRVLYGVGFGLTTTTLGTLAADVIPAARLGEGMGYFGLSTSLAMAVAPLVGISIYNGYGFHVLIFVITGLMLLTAIVLPFIHDRRNVMVGPSTKRKAWQVKLDDFYDHAVLLPCFLLLLLSMTYGALISFITLYGTQLHIANVGWYFLIDAAAILLVRPISGKLYDKLGHISVIPFGALFALVALLLLSYATSNFVFLLSAVFYGVGYGVLQPALQAWMFGRLSAERRGIGSGAFYSSMDLGIAVGSLVFGIIASMSNFAMTYRIAALCLFILLVTYTIHIARSRRFLPSNEARGL